MLKKILVLFACFVYNNFISTCVIVLFFSVFFLFSVLFFVHTTTSDCQQRQRPEETPVPKSPKGEQVKSILWIHISRQNHHMIEWNSSRTLYILYVCIFHFCLNNNKIHLPIKKSRFLLLSSFEIKINLCNTSTFFQATIYLLKRERSLYDSFNKVISLNEREFSTFATFCSNNILF